MQYAIASTDLARIRHYALRQRELNWAAGLFDGEGFIGFHRKSRQLSLYIPQKDRRVLDRFKAVVKEGKIYYGESGGLFRFSVGRNQSVRKIFYLLYPYLSPVKQEQGLKAIKAYDNYLNEPIEPFKIVSLVQMEEAFA